MRRRLPNRLDGRSRSRPSAERPRAAMVTPLGPSRYPAGLSGGLTGAVTIEVAHRHRCGGKRGRWAVPHFERPLKGLRPPGARNEPTNGRPCEAGQAPAHGRSAAGLTWPG